MTHVESIADRPAGDEPVGEEPGSAMRAPASPRRVIRPAHVALAILIAGALVWSTSPVNDLDSYWHVQIGREILERHALSGLGHAWLGVPHREWHTSQWLSEVGMYLAVDRIGWVALPMLRLLTGCALVTVLVLTLVRRRQPIAAFVVVMLVVVGLVVLLQDRPQTISLVFIALLAAGCERLWALGRRPPLLLVAVLSLVWAQLHGLWVLAPAAFALVALGGLLDRRHAPRGQVRVALLCAGASLSGVLNPIGPASFLLPFGFRNSAGRWINEWAPTTFTSSLSLCWGLLLCLIVWAWVRGRTRIAITELLWVFVWTVFGVLAMRNVGPSILLIAPVALRALERAGGKRLDRLTRDVSPRENRILAGMLAAVAALGGALAAGSLWRMDPLEHAPALGIARHLDAVEGPLRIWNGYNASGVLIAFGGGARGHLKLVVDGRADLWGGPYIDRLMRTESLTGDWRATFASFRPDAAVLPQGTALGTYLTDVDHWRVAQVDRSYVLLVPQDSPLHSEH